MIPALRYGLGIMALRPFLHEVVRRRGASRTSRWPLVTACGDGHALVAVPVDQLVLGDRAAEFTFVLAP